MNKLLFFLRTGLVAVVALCLMQCLAGSSTWVPVGDGQVAELRGGTPCPLEWLNGRCNPGPHRNCDAKKGFINQDSPLRGHASRSTPCGCVGCGRVYLAILDCDSS